MYEKLVIVFLCVFIIANQAWTYLHQQETCITYFVSHHNLTMHLANFICNYEGDHNS